MSETATAESVPTPTAEVATQVIESFEVSESPGESTPEPAAATPLPSTDRPADAAVTTPTPGVVEQLTPAQKFLRDQGHKSKRDDGRPNWLKLDTVEKMLDRYVEQHRGTWTTEKSALEQARDQLKADIEELYTGIRGDEQAFMQMLASHDPRYKRYLEQHAAPAPPQTPKPADDPEPGPDLDLGDGRMTYSLEGLKKLRAWERREYQRELDTRLKPFQEREQAEKDRAERARFEQSKQARHQQQMTEAQTWPMFGTFPTDGSLTPFQQEVLDALKADQSLDLRGAYMKVALPRLTEDDSKKRERLLKELSTTATSTPTAVRGPEAPKSAKPMSTAEITRRTMDRLEKGA